MDYSIQIMTPEERKYTYTQSQQIISQTGCIGHLRADLGSGEEFYSAWDDHRGDLKTPEFKRELDQVTNALRFGPIYVDKHIHRFLNDPTLRRFCTCANSGNYRTLIIRAQVDLTLGPTKDAATYYSAYFQNAGVLNLILEWFNEGPSIPEETIVEIIHEFSKTMYK